MSAPTGLQPQPSLHLKQVDTLQEPPARTVEHAAVRADALPGPEAAKRPAVSPDGPPLDSLNRSFAGVRAVVNIADADPERARATGELLQLLAAQLGLPADSLEIHVDAEAGTRTAPRGAAGLSERDIVYLDPRRYSPHTREGRYLLGHEVVHAAQRQARPSGHSTAAARQAAEIEAHLLGQAFAEQGYAAPARVSLPSEAVAADTDVHPALDSALVKETRAAEIKRIQALLTTGLFDWAITDGDVEEILTILGSMPFATAQAVVGALEPGQRIDLVANINPVHFRHRAQVLACYAALQPGEFKKFDAGLVEKMDLGALSVEEHQALIYTLQNLSRDARAELLTSDNAKQFKELILSPALPREQLELAAKRAEQARAQEEERRQAIAQMAGYRDSDTGLVTDPEAKKILDQIGELMSSFIVTDAKALRALEHLRTIQDDTPRLQLVVEQLEARGQLDTLLDNIPAESRFDPPANLDLFLKVISFRPAAKNVELARSLLSYGLLDYSVSAEEARFAYHLIKVLPLEAQDYFRRMDEGKWFRRMEAAIDPNLLKSGEYRGIEVEEKEGLLRDAAEDYAARLQAGDAQKALDELLALCAKGINHDTAETIYRRLVAVGQATDDAAADSTLLGAIVRRLDAQGYLQELFGELSDAFILSEENRASTIRIMLARDPLYAQEHARQLLHTSIFDAVYAREAYLAYQLVRALPPAEQRAFQEKDHGAQWDKILSEMTSQMRMSADLNAHVERDGGLQRGAILGQLMAGDTWSEANASRLDALIRMAIAMGERKRVFEESEHWSAYTHAGLLPLVQKYKLYEKPVRTTYRPNDFTPTGYFDEGLFQSLKSFGRLIPFVFGLHLWVNRNGVGVQADLNQFQKYEGGDISGVRLAQAAQPALAKPGDGSQKEKEAANQVSVQWHTDEQALDLQLPVLRIEGINYHKGTLNVQSGAVELDGLKIWAAFSDPEFARPAQVKLDADRLDLRDGLLTFPDSLIAVNHVALNPLHVALAAGEMAPENAPPHHAGIPIVEPLIRLVRLALQMYRGAAKDRLDTVESVEVSFGSLQIEGLNINGGQQVETFKIRDFDLQVAATKPAYLRARIASLGRRIKQQVAAAKASGQAVDVAPLEQQMAAARAELETLKPQEIEFKRLHVKAERTPDELTAPEQQRLAQLQADLKGGLVLDVGEVSLAGASGRVNVEQASLEDIHGEGESAGLSLDALSELVGPKLVSDPAVLQRFAATGAKPQVLKEGLDDSTIRVDVGRFTTSPISVLAAVPASADLEKEVAKLEAVKDQPEEAYQYKLLSDKLAEVRRYERLAARDPAGLTRSERDELAALNAKLSKEVLARSGPITLDKPQVGLDLASGKLTIGGKRLLIAGVELPSHGASVREISGRDFSVGVSLGPGLAGLQDLPKSLAGADVQAGSLEATGFRLIESEQRLEFELARLKAQDLSGVDEKARLAAQTKIEQITNYLDGLRDIRRRKAAAEEALAGATDEAGRARAQQELSDMNDLLQEWQTKLAVGKFTLRDVDGRITGFDALFKEGAGRKSAGVQLQGKDGKPIFAGGTATDLVKRDVLDPRKQSGVARAELGAATGIVRYTGSTIELEDFGLEQLTLGGLSYQGYDPEKGFTQIWTGDNQAHVTLNKVGVTGTIHLTAPPEAVEKTDPAQAQQKMMKIDIHHLGIESIEAQGLSYFSSNSQLQLDIASGKLVGIEVNDFSMLIPEGEGKNQITGGTVDVKKIQDVDVGGGVIGGLRGSAKINAEGLRVGFAKDNSTTVDLDALNAAGHLTNEDLDLAVNLRARGLHAHLRSEGKSDFFSVQAKQADLGAKGTVKLEAGKRGKLDLKTSLTGLDTGEIENTDEYTKIPNLRIPLTTLDRMNWSGGDIAVSIPEGNPITLEDTRVGVTIEKEQVPGKVLDGKPETRTRQIIIDRFLISKVTTRGLYFDIKDTFGLSLPPGVPSYLEGVELRGVPGRGEGFAISRERAGKGWTTLGQLGVRKFDLERAHADVAGLMNATANMKGEDLVVGTISTSKFSRTVADLRKLKLEEVQGEIQGTKFSLVTSGADKSRHPGVKPGVEVTDLGAAFHTDKEKNKTTLEYVRASKLGIQGAVVDMADKGIKLDIADLQLPAGFEYRPAGIKNVVVPDLLVNNAYLRIDDLMKLSEGGGGKSPYELQDYNFLDKLNGHLELKLFLPIELNLRVGPFAGGVEVSKIQSVFPVALDIDNGRVNFKSIEHGTLNRHLDEILDFEVKERDGKTLLVLQFDPKRMLAEAGATGGATGGPGGAIAGGLGGYAVGALASSDIMTWTLDQPGEAADAKTRELARLKRLRAADKSTSSSDMVKPVFRTELMEYRDVKADLSLLGESTIDLGKGGKIHLGAPGKDAVQHLRVPTATSSTAAGGLPLELEEANLSVENLMLGGSRLTKAEIRIAGVKDSHLTFAGPLPKGFEATVTQAEGKNIEVRLPERE